MAERYSPAQALAVLGRSATIAYERMGMVVITSIAWYFATLASATAAGITIWALPLAAVLVAPLSVAITYFGNLAVHREDAGFRELWRGYTKFWVRAVVLGAVNLAVVIILWIDIRAIMTAQATWMRMLAGAWIYLGLFAGLLFMYAYPVMVEQDTTPWKAIRRAVILILDNPAYTLTIGLLDVVLLALGVLPTVLLLSGSKAAGYMQIIGVAAYAGFNAVFRNLAAVRLLQRYDAARESDRERLQKQLEVEKMTEGIPSTTGKVEIRWLGHACFLITAGDGTRILTDPFDDTVGYDLPTVPADIVTVSHAHFDHNNVGVVQGSPEVVDSPGDRSFGGVRIRGVHTCHDTKGGALRGRNIVFIIETDNVAICHAGDLGHVPSDETVKNIGRVDVLLIPVGGTYTLDARGAEEAVRKLGPKIVIPMHYKTRDLKLTELDSAERFLAGLSRVERATGSSYTVQASSLPRDLTAVVLGYRK
jgi:L-ascorbate metabolism protein UlaG (beta-lactamase superfamily)/uncharacterized membrane protein YesL